MDTFSEGIFANLNNKKLALEARGKKVYDLFVGTPDFKPDASILNAMQKALEDPNNIKYSLHDMDILKDRFIKHYKDRFHVSLNRNQIMTVNGTQEGMCHIGMLLANPGEYCLLPDPGYVAFTASAKFARLNIITYPLLEKNDFMPRLDLLDSSVLKKIKYVITISFGLKQAIFLKNKTKKIIMAIKATPPTILPIIKAVSFFSFTPSVAWLPDVSLSWVVSVESDISLPSVVSALSVSTVISVSSDL